MPVVAWKGASDKRGAQTGRAKPGVDWYTSIFELIDTRSFSNLWFWIALAVMWSTASHWVLGVPYDMVHRARRVGGQAEQDLEDIVRVNISRMLYITRVSGLFLLAFVSFLLTSLVLLGFVYEVEFAQALFLLGFPMTIVGVISLTIARRIDRDNITGEDLRRQLTYSRLFTQMIGAVSIFVTALWGMYQNFTLGVLGG